MAHAFPTVCCRSSPSSTSAGTAGATTQRQGQWATISPTLPDGGSQVTPRRVVVAMLWRMRSLRLGFFCWTEFSSRAAHVLFWDLCYLAASLVLFIHTPHCGEWCTNVECCTNGVSARFNFTGFADTMGTLAQVEYRIHSSVSSATGGSSAANPGGREWQERVDPFTPVPPSPLLAYGSDGEPCIARLFYNHPSPPRVRSHTRRVFAGMRWQ